MIHLSRIDVAEGSFVQPGQVIGAVGDTGASAGPHLHWGLYVHGVSVDPGPWLASGFE
jgi:murein DD-endopeptidase MepM/ murein hydrolase activator NlpD